MEFMKDLSCRKEKNRLRASEKIFLSIYTEHCQ